MEFQQDEQLIKLLLQMQECPNFGICAEAKYDPSSGHIPRGFAGATSNLTQVLLVIVMAEPGFPLYGEEYTGEPKEDLKSLLKSRYLKSGENKFHRNVLSFLNEVFPMFNGDVDKILKHVWLTESRHCSIAHEIGNIGKKDRLICAKSHLVEQIKLFPNAIVLLAGGKAQQAKKLIKNPIECGAFAPPGCNQTKVRQSHKNAAKIVKHHIAACL